MDDYLNVKWRVGTKNGRTIYADVEGPRNHELQLGTMDTPELAAEVVKTHNASLAARNS